LLALILAVAGIVVAARRTDAPWARAFRAYLVLGLVVIAIRVAFRIVLGGATTDGEHVVVHLPSVALPGFMAGVSIGGAVSAESIVAALYDGFRLATLLCCIGAANTLANPKRALRSLPTALYELGVAITVAVVIAPQLVESVQRVRRARRLRGATESGRRAVRGIAMPVLHDALDRSFALASAMDARGYGRHAGSSKRARLITSTLLIGALLGLCVGAYALLDPSLPRITGVPLVAGSLLAAAAGFFVGGARVRRTRYRPDPWRAPEWLVTICGITAASTMIVAAHMSFSALNPSVAPLTWPTLPLLPVVGLAIATLPAVLTPPPVARPVPVPKVIDLTTPAPTPVEVRA
jgi:energy-coupling factor transport system permease protein